MADDSRILADQETGLQPPCDERSRAGISTQILTNIWSGTGICIIHSTISLLTASRALCFQEPINRLFIDKHALIEKANVGRQEPEGEFSFALLPPLPSPFLLLSSEPPSEEVARSQVRAARVWSLIDSRVTKKFLRFQM